MDLIKVEIPAAFVEDRTRLTWREASFGVDAQLLAENAVVDLAANRLAAGEEPVAALVELADRSCTPWSREALDALAASEPEQSVDALRRTWLYLVLAWYFERRADFSDPLQIVEEVYADFDYPEDIAHFVRYMPSKEPSLGSVSANEARLVEHWKAWLDEQERAHARRRA